MSVAETTGIVERLLQDRLTLSLTIVGLYALYALVLAVYRLFLCPIAKIPGNKLTIITGWYEVYLDVILGGQFTFEIEKWHKKYGPIIRINPWEVHISDANFFNELYSNGSKYSKLEHLKWRFGQETATFDTVEHRHHDVRRGPLNVFYSRQKIQQFSPYIHRCAEKIVERIKDDFSGSGQTLSMTEAWGAFTLDVMTMHTFALDYKFLESPRFEAPFTTALGKLIASVHWMGHFPWAAYALRELPEKLVELLNPDMKAVFDFQGLFHRQIKRVLDGENVEHHSVAHKPVFHEILNTKMPKEELTFDRLKHEAASLLAAGVETTRSALSYATYFILAHPEVERRLRAELERAIPDSTKIPALPELEALPYLTAVIREGIRRSMGPAARQPRTNPYGPIRYGEYTIPTGTPFGMSAYLQLRDAEAFPNPDTYNPDRWLEEPGDGRGGDILKPVPSQYQPFGRGPRWCLGMNLAMAEVYIGLATFFRNVDGVKLFDTGPEVVEMKAEYIVPIPKSSKGVRVTVG